MDSLMLLWLQIIYPSGGKMNRRRIVLVGLLIFSLTYVPSNAQTGSGVVRGAVQDATKSMVPRAKVELRNQDTNITREATTSTEGSYFFGGIQPGNYELTVEAQGFKKWTGTLALEVGQTAVVDPALEVGSLANTVEVSGVAPVITTEGMQVADVKDELRIHQLPLNGRSVSNLFNLTPGVEGGGSPRVNGLKVGSVEMLQDGISIVNRFCGGVNTLQRRRPALQSSS